MSNPSTPPPLVDPDVPDELWFAVFCGAIDEISAIERGRLAASARSEEERRAILFDGQPTPEDIANRRNPSDIRRINE